MKRTKRFIMMILTVIMLFSVVAICAQAASLDYTNANYGSMVPTDAKFTKSISTVKLYGDYDYINFLIESKSNDVYFFYEIYSDKDMTKIVGGGSTYCADSGSYVFSPAIKLKGNFKSDKTYYCVSYAATIDDAENVKVSEKSVKTFKLKVTLKPKFKQKVVILKSVKNTVDGPTISWKKLSNGTKKYVVYRKGITDAKWKKIATVKGDTYSYTDKSIKDKNVTYMYTVKGCDKNGTKTRCQYNGLLALYAKAPKVTAVNVTTDNKIEIKWKSSSPTATYRIYRSENNGKYKLVAKNITGTTYYDDTAKNSGSRYKYAVKAAIPTEYGTAVSSYKATKNRTFLAAPELNPVVVTDNGLSISWSSVNGATGYTVYRKTLDEKAEFTELAKVDANTLAFTDTTANAQSAFSYTVRAITEKVNGSYNSKGAEYCTLSQPEFTITQNEHIIHLNWEPVKNAEGYYILNKNDKGEWSVYQTITAGTDFSLYVWQTHEKLQLTVQAYRGDRVSDFKEDVAVIDYWAKANAEYAIYTDAIYFTDYSGRYNTTYNLYRKLATQSDDEYKLISSDIAGSSGEWVYLSDDTDVEYDTEYVYQVRMSYLGVEQQSNIQTINIIKYSPEKYIDSFDVTTKKENDNYIFYFDGTKKNEAKSFKESVYVNSTTFWANTQSTEKWVFDDWSYDIDNLRFGYVVSNEKGSTPIDGFVVDKSIK